MSDAAPRTEIVAIGTELLLGDTVDGNGAWLGRVLSASGFMVTRRSVVGDDASAIRDVVTAALERAGLVICSGGLGPTSDDMTRPVLAEMFGRPLEMHGDWLAVIESRYRERGHAMTDSGRTQALLPRGAHLLPNRLGSAPGLVLEDRRGAAILLPGVPHELRGLMLDEVLPWLRSRWPFVPPVRSHRLRTAGMSESVIADRVEDLEAAFAPLTLAYLPSAEGVDLRLTAWALPEQEASPRIAEAARRLRERLGPAIYGTDDDDLAAVVGRMVAERGWRMALAESCTGGLLAARVTDIAGASAWFDEGFVTYADVAKVRRLHVAEETLREHGAVSEATVRAMVEGARRESGAECAIAITGIAGPGGGSEEKPVGTVWIAAAAAQTITSQRFYFSGGRAHVRARSAQAGLVMLRSLLLRAMP